MVNNHPGGNRGTVTGTAGSGEYITGQLLELSPLAASPLDHSVGTTGFNNTFTVTTGTSTAQANEFVLAFANTEDGLANFGFGAYPAGYTPGWIEQDSNTHQGGQSVYKIVNTTGVQSAGFTIGGGYETSRMIITLKFA